MQEMLERLLKSLRENVEVRFNTDTTRLPEGVPDDELVVVPVNPTATIRLDDYFVALSIIATYKHIIKREEED